MKTAREFGIQDGALISSKNCFENIANRQGASAAYRTPAISKPETPEEKEARLEREAETKRMRELQSQFGASENEKLPENHDKDFDAEMQAAMALSM